MSYAKIWRKGERASYEQKEHNIYCSFVVVVVASVGKQNERVDDGESDIISRSLAGRINKHLLPQ